MSDQCRFDGALFIFELAPGSERTLTFEVRKPRGISGNRFQPVHIRPRNSIEESPGVRVPRILEKLGGGPLLYDSARVEHAHTIAVIFDQTHVVRDQDDARVHLFLEIAEKLHHLGLQGHVESRGGLIGDQNLGLAGESNRDDHSLPLAAAELVRVRPRNLLGLRQLDSP